MLEQVRPTELLYLDGDVGERFEATVTSVDCDSCELILDATAFYPTGGHQHCDQGRIEKNRSTYAIITDVKMDPVGRVIHTYSALRGSLKPGDHVTGSIQWDRRLHHAQLHTAQHLLSSFARTRFGVGTGRADFSPSGGLAVLEEALDWEQLILLEDDVNRVIREDRPISRRMDGERVLLNIEGVDENPCRGTHVMRTAEIGLFKLTRVDDRVLRYETGEHAKRIATRRANHALRASLQLQLDDTRELSKTIDELIAQRAEAEDRLAEWREQATARELTKAYGTTTRLAGEIVLLQVDLSHLKARDAREFLRRELAQEDQLWICLADRRSVLVSSSIERHFAHEIIAEFVDRWGIQGGGNRCFAQGGPVPEEVAAPLDVIAHWLAALPPTN